MHSNGPEDSGHLLPEEDWAHVQKDVNQDEDEGDMEDSDDE